MMNNNSLNGDYTKSSQQPTEKTIKHMKVIR